MNRQIFTRFILTPLISFLIAAPSETVFAQKRFPVHNTELDTHKLNDPDDFDVKLFRSINNRRTDMLNKTLKVTDKSVLPAAFVLPAGMIIYGRAADKPFEENTGVLLALSEVTNFVLTFGLKNVVRRERPYKTLDNVHHRNLSIADEYSFPSNHTGTAFSIATTFALRYTKYPQLYVPMYFWGLVVGYGRIYWGMHYPSDVLGGALLGSLSAITIYSLRAEIIKAKNKLLGENDNQDHIGHDSRTTGLIVSASILATILNEFIWENTGCSNFIFHPAAKNSTVGLSCRLNLKL